MEQLKKDDKKQKAFQITGCLDSQQVNFMSGIAKEYSYSVVVTHSEKRAREIYEDFLLYTKDVSYYPAKDFIFYSADIHGTLTIRERLNTIRRLVEGQKAVIVTTIDGLMDKLIPIRQIKDNVLTFQCGDTVNLNKLQKELISMCYERVGQVELSGQFAIRGGIIDIFPLSEESPIRIDLWDDEIDSIKYFDVESQRSITMLEEVSVYPATEYILSQEQIASGLKKIHEEMTETEQKFRQQMKTEEAHRIKTVINDFTEQLNMGNTNVSVDSFINYFYEESSSLIEYLEQENTIFLLDEPARLEERSGIVEKEFRESMINRLEKGYLLAGQVDVMKTYPGILALMSRRQMVVFTALEQKVKGIGIADTYHIEAKNIISYNSQFDLLVKDLKQYKKKGYRILILTTSRTRAERLAENLRDYEIEAFYSENPDRILKSKEIMVSYGNLHKGFEYPLLKFVVITQTDIFGREKAKKRRAKKQYSGKKIQSFSELNIGDYVVHENHGLGIYRGIEKIEVDKVAKDYIKIEYADNSNLYILATGLDLIQKYAGSDAVKIPKINKLGTQEWSRTKSKVKTAVKDIARDLVALYSARQNQKGFQFSQDNVWQKEFEEIFPYEETMDQLTAIEAMKKDMESDKIMDRLVCGDVGYGKTEIAIRGAFKAVQDGKQVVVLVPTTILAQQHYNTFTQRMKDYPIRIDLLSRFRTAAGAKMTIEGLKTGEVDIVIGTHKVLSKDVKFKDLGLLVVDEEQRFGVTHKEKIKTLKQNVDVLTLSATPIPRTLHMSLVGIRDMSVLEEPPVDRLPIQTYVMEFDDEMVREAINRELIRGGQVYYVYNRVNNIDEIAAGIAKLVPDANVVFAHGQMSERKLEQIMYDFIEGEIDVLVSTTIIETGLDISNVNTIIIHDADNFGLSQLYQLRGRVGRSNRTSYAFLMYKRDKMLKEVAEKRLQAIREFTELGSGIKIAMKDLEIRGAGNILGARQHGHMESVGYDLYCKLLNEAVAEEKGMEVMDSFETKIDISIDAFIPPQYIKNEFQKLNVYKQIASIESEEEYRDMQDELMDRFGELPKNVENLLSIALIKALAHKAWITEISNIGTQLKFAMYREAKIDVAGIQAIIDRYKGKLKFVTDSIPYFMYTMDKTTNDMKEYKQIILDIIGDISSLAL
ncbi:MAG: transcription-repair coupling factor [Lachnospiraceae bacterium]|nr:transcription-repair coupling factor [Lachnospiraceae bacterium]